MSQNHYRRLGVELDDHALDELVFEAARDADRWDEEDLDIDEDEEDWAPDDRAGLGPGPRPDGGDR